MKFKITLLCIGMLFCGSFLHPVMAQTLSVSGKVKNKTTNESLIGATVTVAGTTNSTITDANGNFKVSLQKGATLLVTYTGMNPVRFTVTKEGPITIELEDMMNSMDEFVVMGYGTQKVTKVSGAISTVKGADIEKLRPVRAEDALQGRASGVTVVSNGSPGAKPTVLIRGIPSYSGTDPVVIVDGSVQSLDDLNSINAADIESVNVLKDAATTAIYGVKGGNGVILVTTKSGKKNQKTEINYSSNFGVQQVMNTIGVLNATEYAAMINEGNAAAGLPIVFSNLSTLGIGTNWQDQVFKNAGLSSHTINAKGGSDKIGYFVSGAYTGQGGIVGGSDKSYFNRANATANINIDLAPKFKFIANTSFVNIKGANVAENGFNSVLGNALNFDPTVPVLNNVPGTYGKYGVSTTILSENFNPLTQLENTYNKSNTSKLYGKLELQYDVAENLKITSRYGYTNTDVTGKGFAPLVYYGIGHANSTLNPDGTTIAGKHNSVSEYKTNYFNNTFETFANYDFKLKEDHSFDVVAGFSMSKVTGNNISGSREDVPFNSWNFADISAATGVPTDDQSGYSVGSYQYERRNLSYFGRLNYDYKEKYLASFSARKDGSYAFGANNKFANFYAGSLAWVVSSEDFFKSDFIDYLKLRASFGTTGNENVSPQYQKIASGVYEYGSGNHTGYPFGPDASIGSTLASFSNDNLSWEKQEQLNVGFDLYFMDNKFSLSGDYFQKNISGLLFTPSLSLYLGTAALPTANIGTTETKGLDLNLGYTNTLGKNFKLNTNLTFTTAKNLVTETNDGFIVGGKYGIPEQAVTRFETGNSPGYFFGYKTNGLFQNMAEIAAAPTQANAKPGDIRYADVNGDGLISDLDRTKIGDPFPTFTMGWNLSLEYKGFDFNTFVYASVGNDIYRAFERNLLMTNKYRGVLARWTGEGSTNDARNPRYTASDDNRNTRASDRYVEDGSFIKIKDVQLGYTFPGTFLKSKAINKLRIYAQVKNAYTFTKYSGYDPEISGGILDTGIDRGAYPQARTWSLGLDVKF